jgi:hypothetical protein
MSHDHVVELPKAVWGIKIVQSIIAVLVLAFSAFTIAVIPNGYSGFCIYTVSESLCSNLDLRRRQQHTNAVFIRPSSAASP